MPPTKFITRTRLSRALRKACGCRRAKAHAKAMLLAGRALGCMKAHPPTPEDEAAATQRWFAHVPSTRRTHALAGGRWNGGPSGPVGLSERRFYRLFAK